jgi:hypothetical protein
LRGVSPLVWRRLFVQISIVNEGAGTSDLDRHLLNAQFQLSVFQQARS